MSKPTLILFFISTSWLYSQTEKDSLLAIWNSSNYEDTIRLQAMDALIYKYYIYDTPQVAYSLIYKKYQLARKIKNVKYEARAINLLGYYYYYLKKDYVSAIKYYMLSLKRYKAIKDYHGQSKVYSNMAIAQAAQYNYHDALINYSHALNLYRRKYIEPDTDYLIINSNLGDLYERLGKENLALKYFNKGSLPINKSNNHPYHAYSYIRSAAIYINNGNYLQAKENLDKSMHILATRKREDFLVLAYGEYAKLYYRMGDKKKSDYYNQKCHTLAYTIKDEMRIVNSLLLFSDLYREKGNLNASTEYAKKALTLSKKIRNIEKIHQSLYQLLSLYDSQKKYQDYVLYSKEYDNYNDSLNNLYQKQKLFLFNIENQARNQKIQDSLSKIDQIKLQELEFNKKVRNQQLNSYLLGVFIIFLSISILIIRRNNKRKIEHNRIIKSQNIELERLKNIAEEKASELNEIVKVSKQMIISIEENSKIVYLNQASIEILGLNDYKEKEYYTLKDIFPIHEYIKIKKIVDTISKDKGFWCGETQMIIQNHNTLPVLVSLVYIPLKHIPDMFRISIIAQDIVKIKAYEEELKQQNFELEKVNKELNRLVYSTSHELRSPLISVLSLISIGKEEYFTDDVFFQELMVKMEDSLRNAEQTLNDILDYTKNHQSHIKVEKISMEEMIVSIKKSLIHLKESKDVRIEINITCTTDFYTDKYRLYSILSNLMVNALKYQRKEESDKFIKVYFSCEENFGNLLIEDNGEGISETLQEKVFEMFYRASDSTQGSGLGLYIVKQTIEKLQATLTVESIKGKGTTFTIRIPNKREKIINLK